MSRSVRFWCLLSLAGYTALSLFSPLTNRGFAKPPGEKPAAPAHGHDEDHEHDEGPAQEARPERVFTPEDEARRKQVIAKVEGTDITVATVEDYIDQQSPIMRMRFKDPAELKKLIDNMVRFELLAAEAQRRDYAKNKSVVRTVKDSAVQNLLRTDVEEKITPETVSDEEVKAYYDAHHDEFHRAAARRASHILVETEAEAKRVIAEAQKADARGFMELAKKYSKDLETKLRGGDLSFFNREPPPNGTDVNVPMAIRKAAFELKAVGDTSSKPVAVDGGFSILRLTGERPERNTTLEEAEHPIRTKIWREKRQKALTDLVEGLRGKDKPQVFTDRVDWVKLEDVEKQPPGFPPGGPQGGTLPPPGTSPHHP
jgi:peptidyl-prolyl cis-trans isomerase C